MDLARLELLHSLSCYHKVACTSGGTVVAFILAFSPGSSYDSKNYAWFNQRYKEFVYVDRVVVGENA